MKNRLTGLIAAPFTALNQDGSVNYCMIERQAQALADSGVAGAFICGTTGEGLSLTTTERMKIAERWMETAPKELNVIVHVGHSTTVESRNLAAHAQEIGARAFAAIGPTFFRASNLKQLVDYCAEVASGAPSLPFYYYHMPAMTGADFSMVDFLKLAGSRIPNLSGIKFTHENLMDYSRCLHFEAGRYDILFGRDEILLSALALGARGAVGSTYNYMPSLYQKVIAAFNSGDMETARRYQSMAIEIIAVMARYGGLPAGKAMMNLNGINCGPVRPPLQNLSLEALEQFQAELKAVGFPVETPVLNQRDGSAPVVAA
jgi:N-acetylneuraminate lyase